MNTKEKSKYEQHDHTQPAWPKPLHTEAFQGLAGEVMQLIEPQSESDPAALLIQFLTTFGNSIGSSAYVRVEADNHHANLFSLIVGKTAKSRKGTSWGHIRNLFELASQQWSKKCIATGLSSGEGLICAVRDGQAHDKRLLIYEPEFSSVLRVQRREGNTLSAKLRSAWDSGTMQILTKQNPVKATGAHVSIVAHITQDELKREFVAVNQTNGYANRFLFVCAQRSKRLPNGGQVKEKALKGLAEKLQRVRTFARSTGKIERSEHAEKIWSKWYNEISDEAPGMLGAITSRAEAQVVRLSMIYALLEHSRVIRTRHLEAALAVWKYCEASVRYIFGTGDKNADRICQALLCAGEEGMTTTEIRHRVFSGNLKGEETKQALQLLLELRLVKSHREPTSGRTTRRWFALGV